MALIFISNEPSNRVTEVIGRKKVETPVYLRNACLKKTAKDYYFAIMPCFLG